MTDENKSVITCDLEGRIQTFNPGAERMFGYVRDEIVGRQRVSLFSPGLVVLGHVGRWLEEARTRGEMETTTVFVRKDGSRFAAKIRITPTSRNGQQIGYCGVTVPLPDVSVEDAMPPISWLTRLFAWMVVTRAPFLTAIVVPVLVGAAAAAHRGASPYPWGLLGLVLLGAIALHVAANVFNDYFDWASGTDQANTDYFLPFSGGSRAVELGLVGHRTLLAIGGGALAVAAACGAGLISMRGAPILVLGVVGILSGWFYTAPPLRLAARRGLGELLVALNFGPLAVAGTVLSLTGTWSTSDVLLGVPVGLLTAAILLINEFPDAASDALTGKNHLVVVLGKRRARWLYVALLVLAFASLASGVFVWGLPRWALLALLTLPIAARAADVAVRRFDERALSAANAATIRLHALAGALMALGIWLG